MATQRHSLNRFPNTRRAGLVLTDDSSSSWHALKHFYNVADTI